MRWTAQLSLWLWHKFMPRSAIRARPFHCLSIPFPRSAASRFRPCDLTRPGIPYVATRGFEKWLRRSHLPDKTAAIPNSTKDMPAETYDLYSDCVAKHIHGSGVINNPIVLMTDIRMKPETESKGVQTKRIAWLLSEREHKIFYVTNVEKGTAPKDDEDVFTYILKGDLTIKSRTYSHTLKGDCTDWDDWADWFLIKRQTSYSVTDVNGCTVLAAKRVTTDSTNDYYEQQYTKHIQDALDHSGVEPNPIVFSTEIPIAPMPNSQITPIAWLLYEKGHKMFYVKKVPAETYIKPHTHPEAVFRYITEGDLTITSTSAGTRDPLTQGDWFLVKEGISYSITTVGGYTVLAAYQTRCATVVDH